MNGLGTSHIAFADLLVCSIALLLIWGMHAVPRDSSLSRVLAILCSGIMWIIVLGLFVASDSLQGAAQFEVSMIAFNLCLSLLIWEQKKVKKAGTSSTTDPELSH